MSKTMSNTPAALLFCALSLTACDKAKQHSAAQAREHVAELSKTAETDVGEVRAGLPQGVKHLEPLYAKEAAPRDDLPAVREALERARSKVQDLRVAKSTFFAVVDADGTVLRNDQDQDLMAGKNLLKSFPGLKPALEGKYVEARGTMPEAARVKGPDGQWVAAQPIVVDGKTKGLYVTGWSWSAYAYRLENALRGSVRSALPNESAKMPLIYVYVVVADQAFGAPVSPEVSGKAILEQKPLERAKGDEIFVTTLEITGRDFGLAVKRVPALGEDVALAVLRSET